MHDAPKLVTDEQFELGISKLGLNPQQAATARRLRARQMANEQLGAEPVVGGVPGNEMTSQQMDALGRVFQSVGSTAIGAGTGFLMGGPPAALAGGVAGFVGDVADQATTAATGSGLAGAGAGLTGDALASLILRRPSGGMGRRLIDMASPTRRAGRALNQGGLLQKLGREGIDEVVGVAQARRGKLVEANQKAWEIANEATSGTRVSSAPVRKAARRVLQKMKGVKGDEKSQAALAVFGTDEFNEKIIDDTMTAGDAQILLSRIAEDMAAAAGGPQNMRTRSVGTDELKKAVDGVLDQIASMSSGDAAAVASLRAARAATRRLYQEFPPDSGVMKLLIGDKALDPEKAIQRLLNLPVREVDVLIRAVKDDPGAMRGLRRVAIQRMFGRVAGATGEIAPRSAGAAASRGEAEHRVLRKILGDDAFATVQKNLKRVHESARRGNRKFVPEVIAGRTLGVTPLEKAGGALGAVVGLALGTSPFRAGLIGATGGFVIQQIAERYGPTAGRLIALEALQNDAVMKRVASKAFSDPIKTEKLMESFVRRGILTARDFARLESHAPAPMPPQEELTRGGIVPQGGLNR